MSTRNVDAFFTPRSVALVGASARPGSVGSVLAANLAAGGFAGPLMFVSPSGGRVQGHEVFRHLADLPEAPELAVIATPAAAIPGVIRDLAARGCRAAVVISAGFEAQDPETLRLRQAVLDACRPTTFRIVGPNCLGVLSPGAGLNASFARGAAPAGNLALVAQSGAVAATALDWAPRHGVGFSRIVTLGDSLDVDMGDLLGFLADDAATQAVLLYVESLRNTDKFLRAARAAAAKKPVVVLKGGRSAAGAKAAFSHTGALAGADAVYEAAFRRAGVLEVESLGAFLDAAALFARCEPVTPLRVSLLTNGGGAGVLAVDRLERAGVGLSELTRATLDALDAACPSNWSHANPVDILGDAPPELYGRVLDVLAPAPEAGGVLVMNCPTAVADSTEAAGSVVAALARHSVGSNRPVIACWLGGVHAAPGREVLERAGTPTFDTPEAAVDALGMLQAAGRLRAGLAEALPELSAMRSAAALALVGSALRDGGRALTPPEVHDLLALYHIPQAALAVVASPADAGEAAARIDGPVALKILSVDIPHKSDVGGVRLGLRGGPQVAAEAAEMLARVRAARPDARMDGFMVQAMIDRPQALEILAGVVRDPTFGAAVMVGHGGVAVEVLADRTLELAPLTRDQALAAVARTRVSRLLAGYRDRPPADVHRLAEVLVALGAMAVELPELVELDLNPLLCDVDGAIAIDARIKIAPARTPAP